VTRHIQEIYVNDAAVTSAAYTIRHRRHPTTLAVKRTRFSFILLLTVAFFVLVYVTKFSNN